MILIKMILSFLSLKRIIVKLKRKIINVFVLMHFCFNVFAYENALVYPVHVMDENFENYMDYLSITDGLNSNYVCIIKQFKTFMYNKTKLKNKKIKK